METTVVVTNDQIANAIRTVQDAIRAGRDGTDVEHTAGGILANIIMDLGIRLDNTGEYV